MDEGGVGIIEALVIDVSDLTRGAAFWAAISGMEFGPSFEANFLRASWEAGPDLVLQQVAEVKIGKNRVHLDVRVTDVEMALKTVETLGGSLVARADNEFGELLVCADPDGNEFCLTRSNP